MTSPSSDSRARWQLGFAAAAVLLAAADTYVVVVALPAIMSGVGLGLDQLQRATPIISGFLLGYIAVLPLLGRLSDVVGREPVFAGCLIGFSVGSLITATSHDLATVVLGRALQGVGGGGLVPVAFALVAARWPPERRGLPLGVIGAVQEFGSVVGPLYGAAIVAAAGWRAIFWLNIPLALAVGVAFWRSAPARARPTRAEGHGDVVGAALLVVSAAALTGALDSPRYLADSVAVGSYLTPLAGSSSFYEFTSPVAILGLGLLVAFVVWEAFAPGSVRTFVRPQRLPTLVSGADIPGGLLLAAFLGCIVLVFSTADPSKQLVASSTPIVAPLGVAALVAFVFWQRRTRHPLLDPQELSARPAWGSLAVNLALGAGLMAVLVDVPFFARTTTYPDSQVGAALVLLRFLVAVPIGAVLGGFLCRRRESGPVVAGAGAAIAALGFVSMATWSATALSTPWVLGSTSLGFGASDVELIVAGLGFGLTIAPINAAILDAVKPSLHGLASSLVVVARTVGMLAGLSALTAIGIRRFYEAQAHIGSPITLCPNTPTSCPVYDRATTAALLSELHTIFAGAAICAGVGAVLAVVLLRSEPVSPSATFDGRASACR
ncbi:MAG TPA: MFS transporter [Mycobacteriales bacterium]